MIDSGNQPCWSIGTKVYHRRLPPQERSGAARRSARDAPSLPDAGILRRMFIPTQQVQLTLYTDSFIVRGTAETRERRISDILNQAPYEFIVLRSVTFDEYGSRELAVTSEFAQVNLGTVLFAVANDVV